MAGMIINKKYSLPFHPGLSAAPMVTQYLVTDTINYVYNIEY